MLEKLMERHKIDKRCAWDRGGNRKLIIPDCFEWVVRGIEKEGGCNSVDGTALHVPARV